MINTDVYPQSVDFNYSIRCSSHQFKPYVYCEMCMVRSNLQDIKMDTMRSVTHTLSQSYICLNEMIDKIDRINKIVAEMQIEINLLKTKND
jgi:hypothetical protein